MPALASSCPKWNYEVAVRPAPFPQAEQGTPDTYKAR
jgi:hypothetical protein